MFVESIKQEVVHGSKKGIKLLLMHTLLMADGLWPCYWHRISKQNKQPLARHRYNRHHHPAVKSHPKQLLHT